MAAAVAEASAATSMLSPLPAGLSDSDHPTPPGLVSGSSSPLLLSESDEAPTPKDAHFVAGNAKSSLAAQPASSSGGANALSRRKNRISWATQHAASCASSPRHRYHPYRPAVEAKKASPLAAYLGAPTSAVIGGLLSSSSSPSRSASRSRQHIVKPPRSILKAIRRASISLSASPGRATRSTPLSPARPPRQPTSPFQLSLGAKSPRRSPYKHSPRIPQSPASAALASFGGNPLFPFSPATVVRKKHASGAPTTLAEVTRANGSGRRHLVSFPDLRTPANANALETKQANNASQETLSSSVAEPALATAAEIAPPPPMSLLAALPTFGSPKIAFASMLNAAGSGSAVPGDSAAPAHTNGTIAGSSAGIFGLGIGGSGTNGGAAAGGLAPAFDEQPPSSSGPAASPAEIDPRSYIVSAMQTIRFSLAGPAWSTGPNADQTSAGDRLEQREADCFDSSPVDFPPRNLQDGSQFQLPSSSGRAPPPVYLRELEGAHAAIFTYAHLYITQRYLQLPPHQAAERDELDAAFEDGAEALIAAFEREIHNALNPVPASAQAETSAQELAQAHANVVAAQKAVKHALIHRSGRATPEEDAPSPPAFTSSSSPLALPPAGQQAAATQNDDLPSSSPPELPDSTPPAADVNATAGKPKKLGRSTGEMRRRRGELNIAEAAVQALGALVSCERFWKAFDLTRVGELLKLCASFSSHPLLKSPKHRDLVSSVNWLLANTTLPITFGEQPGFLPREVVLECLNSLLTSFQSCNKTGEKARRVLSEGLRAFRNIMLAAPSLAIGQFLILPQNISTIAFVAQWLVSPAKALRDSAALWMSALAYAMTRGWDDLRSADARRTKARAEGLVNYHIYNYYTQGTLAADSLTGPGTETYATDGQLTVNAQGLMSVISACVQAEDYGFARLMLSSLPILFGRRFRKMQHRGPHAWLTRAVTIKNRTTAAGHGVAHHIILATHMTHSWAGASKDHAVRLLATDAEQRQKILAREDLDDDAKAKELDALRSKLDAEPLWGLGEKSLRVIVQNIETLPTPWTHEVYTASRDIEAAVSLVVAVLYAFSGLAHTLCWTAEHHAMEGVTSGPANTCLSRDLNKLWEAVAAPQLAKLFASEVDSLHTTAYRTLHALLRAGEQGPDDTALARFNLDRLVNPNLLGRNIAQTSSANTADEEIARLLADGIKPADLPAFEAAWVLERREAMFSVFEQAFASMASVTKETVESQRSSAGTPNALTTASGWHKHEDGYPVMPIALSAAVRAFFNTSRKAAEEKSEVNKAGIAREAAAFAIRLTEKAAVPAYMRAALGEPGIRCAILQHLALLLEETFGVEALEAGADTARDALAEAALAISSLAEATPAVSAAQALLSSTFHKSNRLSRTIVFSASGNITDAQYARVSGQIWSLLVPHCTRIAADRAANELLPIAQYLACIPVDPQTHRPSAQDAASFQQMLAVAQDGSWSVYSSLCHVMHCKGRLEDVERFDWAMPALIAAYPDLLGKEAQLVGGTLQRALDGSSMVTAAEVLKPVTAGYLSLQATRWDTCAFLNLHAAVRMLWESNSSDLHAYRIQLVRAFFTHLSENWTTFVTHRSGYLFEMPTFAADFVLALKLDSFEVTSAFVECWNRNVQNLPTFEYPEDLQAALKRLLEQGHTLQLPGWPEDETVAGDLTSAEQEPSSLREPQAAMEDSLEAVSETPDKDSFVRPNAHIAKADSPQLDAPEAALSDTQSSSLPLAEGDTTLEAGNEADVSHLTATQAVAPEPRWQIAPSVTEAALPEIATADPNDSHAVGRSASPIPRMSQIPDIPDLSVDQLPAPIVSTSAIPDTFVKAADTVPEEEAEGSMALSEEDSIDMVPETQYPLKERTAAVAQSAPTEVVQDSEPEPALPPAETQTTRIEESFNESMRPRRVPIAKPRKSATPEVVIISPKKAAPAAVKADKGKGRVIRVAAASLVDDSDSDDGFTLVAASRSNRSSRSSMASDTSRVSNTSNESSRISNKSMRDTSHIQVIIPHKPNIPRPWKEDASPPRKVAKTKSMPVEKRKYASSNVSNVLKQVNSSSFVLPKHKQGLQKTASASLTMTRKPSGVASTTSLPTILHESSPEVARSLAEDSDDEGDVIVTSSPDNVRSTRIKDVSDSLGLSRKRKLQQVEDDLPSSSPSAAAHRRRSSLSEGGRIPRPSPPSTSKRSSVSTQDLVDSLYDASEHELTALFNKLPQKQQKLMHKVLSDALHPPKKARRA